VAEAKPRERTSVTAQRDRALALALRVATDVVVARGQRPNTAVGLLIEKLYEPTPEPTRQEAGQIRILQAAIGVSMDGGEDDKEDDGED